MLYKLQQRKSMRAFKWVTKQLPLREQYQYLIEQMDYIHIKPLKHRMMNILKI